MNEFRLIEVSVLVSVEHVDEVLCHVFIEAQEVLQDRHYLIGTQNTVSIDVELFKTRRYLVISTTETHLHMTTERSRDYTRIFLMLVTSVAPFSLGEALLSFYNRC